MYLFLLFFLVCIAVVVCKWLLYPLTYPVFNRRNRLVLVGQRSRRNALTASPSQSTPLMTLRAAPTTATTSTRRGIALIAVARSPPRANRNGDTLHNSAMVMASRIHPIIDREVAADQVRAHRCVLACHDFVFADRVGLVFAVVDADHRCEPGCATECIVVRLRPTPALAETYSGERKKRNQDQPGVFFAY
jgi:hypothetical protein